MVSRQIAHRYMQGMGVSFRHHEGDAYPSIARGLRPLVGGGRPLAAAALSRQGDGRPYPNHARGEQPAPRRTGGLMRTVGEPIEVRHGANPIRLQIREHVGRFLS